MSGPCRLGSLIAAWDAKGNQKLRSTNADQFAAALAAAWESAVGVTIARRSLPTKFSSGILTVLTASSSWSNELTYLAPEILEKLRRAVPQASVKRLRFVVATGRTKLLLDGERRGTAATFARPAQNVNSLVATATRLREEVDPKALALHLASEQRILNEWRDRAGWRRCEACGRRFAADSAQTVILCAPCQSSRRRKREIRVELALTQAPWMSAQALRQALPQLSDAVYRSTRRRLLTRWEFEIGSAQRRLRRAALTPQDRVTAWSFLMLLTGLPQRDIGRAVVRDVLGQAWTNALFASSTV